MADLTFYKRAFGIGTIDAAFRKFEETLRNYFDSAYYVDWRKISRNIERLEQEFALLSTLCGKPNIKKAATELFAKYPNVIKALPLLIACRKAVSIVVDGDEPTAVDYTFVAPDPMTREDAEHYATFLARSGLAQLFSRISKVGDYATGVEVGLDSNARKNRGGICGSTAVLPLVRRAAQNLRHVDFKQEANYGYLKNVGCRLPEIYKGVVWDFAFWSTQGSERRPVVAEVNHYGSSGSKPSAIAREYTDRNQRLAEADVGFIWITDGKGWESMLNPLKQAFDSIPFLMNIHLASEGLLEFALQSFLEPSAPKIRGV